MPCTYEIQLTNIRFGGDNIGSDWSIDIEINGDNKTLDYKAIDYDNLGPQGFDPGLSWTFNDKQCGEEFLLPIKIKAKEQEIGSAFVDKGEVTPEIPIHCPSAGEAPTQTTKEVSLHVDEQGLFNFLATPYVDPASAIVYFKFEIKASCEE